NKGRTFSARLKSCPDTLSGRHRKARPETCLGDPGIEPLIHVWRVFGHNWKSCPDASLLLSDLGRLRIQGREAAQLILRSAQDFGLRTPALPPCGIAHALKAPKLDTSPNHVLLF